MNNQDNFHTDFLFTNCSFLTGAATVFNIAGDFYEFNKSSTGAEADCKAIGNDFMIVGRDMKRAIHQIEELEY